MTLNELKEEARKILEVKPAQGYEHITFTTGSGGSPKNDVGVPEVHRNDKAEYNTVANGMAYSGEVVIECRSLGIQDKKHRDIYETPSGVLFVYAYSRGSAEYFDSGVLKSPVLWENMKKAV